MADNDRDHDTRKTRAATEPAPTTRELNQSRDEAQRREEQAKQDAEKYRAEQERKIDEGRDALRESVKKRAEEELEMQDAELKAEREKRDAAAKEAERRSKLSPEELAAEISPFAATAPHYPVLSEPHHSAEFILSEANGQRSRENAYIADPATIYVGTPLKKTAEATATQPATYVKAATGADCEALSLYAGGTIPGEGLRVAILARDAEVNGNLLTWGALAPAEQAIAAATLASKGIIIRL